MAVVVRVALIVVAVAVIQAAIWIPLVHRWRRKAAAHEAAFHAEMLASGERTLRGPEKANYRGGTGSYSSVKGNGKIVLTDHRLVFRKISGGVVEIAVDGIEGSRESKGFLGSRVGGQTHFIVITNDPAEVGFFVADRAGWAAAIASLRPA